MPKTPALGSTGTLLVFHGSLLGSMLHSTGTQLHVSHHQASVVMLHVGRAVHESSTAENLASRQCAFDASHTPLAGSGHTLKARFFGQKTPSRLLSDKTGSASRRGCAGLAIPAGYSYSYAIPVRYHGELRRTWQSGPGLQQRSWLQVTKRVSDISGTHEEQPFANRLVN